MALHVAYNYTTHTIIEAPSRASLNRVVKLASADRQSGTWLFAHGANAHEQIKAKLMKRGLVK